MSAPIRRRAGMTLVELLIALTLLGIVGGAVIGVLVRQQRLSSRTAAVVDTRDQGRFTLGTLAAELRGLSSIGGDIAAMSDTSLRIRTNVGTSIICAIGAGRTSFTIPPILPVTPPNGSGARIVLTSFVDPNAPPTANDTVWVLNPDKPSSAPWDSARVLSPGVTMVGGAGTGCPTGSPNFLSGGGVDQPAQSFTVPVSPALPAGITVGSAVRFTRAVRYSLYQETDDLWYLGYQNCTGAGGCGVVQPVSGPFLPPTSSIATTGFRFAYFDSLGVATTVPTNVARIQIIARALSRDSVSSGSSRRTQFVQTDSINVAIRNRI